MKVFFIGHTHFALFFADFANSTEQIFAKLRNFRHFQAPKYADIAKF